MEDLPRIPPMVEQHLLIFTRWPEPGKTKTRLIPALGSEGAAQLQKQLTEHTVKTAKSFLQQDPIANGVTIFYTGTGPQQMEQWLGPDFTYQPQATGDLGDRLQNAFQWAFDQGGKKVVVMGIDCPGITLENLQTAFNILENYPAVMGPALDGGYYLMGLTRPCSSYFEDIDWGTGAVYQQTLAKIQQDEEYQQDCHWNLPTLPDIDRPEDLKYLPKTFPKPPLTSVDTAE